MHMSKYKKCKCNTCIYRASSMFPWTCEYILFTGHMRPCDADNKCTVYKKGPRGKTFNLNKIDNL